MSKKINLEIATLERVVYSDTVDQITLPTKMGEITVLPDHLPIISALKAGEIVIKQEKEEIVIAISGGFIEVKPDKLIILADAAEHTAEIDEAKAEEAKKMAEETLKNRALGKEELMSASRALEFAETRIRVAQKRKHNRRESLPRTE